MSAKIEYNGSTVATLESGEKATLPVANMKMASNIEVTVSEESSGETTPDLICKINNGISVIDTGLTYTRGVVEVRKTGSILWVIDSGVYNFTANFTQANNRTVLQFDLPKWLSNKLPNVNGVYGGTGTIGYFPALAYENVTYTTFNCQSYLKRSAIGDDYDTFQLVYTGLSAVSGGGLCGFHSKMPLLLVEEEITIKTFTIDGETKEFEEGMTWYQWVGSNYAPDSYTCAGENERIKPTGDTYIVDRDGEEVLGWELIHAGDPYYIEEDA